MVYSVRSRTNLGIALRDLGRIDEGEGLLEQALDQLRASFGPDSADALRCEIDLALLRLAQGRAEEAESTAASVAERAARDLGSDPRMRQVARDLARLDEKLGRDDQAADWRERANTAGK